MVKLHSINFIALLFFLLQIGGCGGRTVIIEEPGDKTGIFRDPMGLFEATVPAGFEYVQTSSDVMNVHEFIRKDDDGDVMEKVRFTVEKVLADQNTDVFSSDYENRFTAACKCAVLERGVVNIDGKPGKQYRTALRNSTWVGYQWHVSHRDHFVIVGARGPVENSRRIKELFDLSLKDFHFLSIPE